MALVPEYLILHKHIRRNLLAPNSTCDRIWWADIQHVVVSFPVEVLWVAVTLSLELSVFQKNAGSWFRVFRSQVCSDRAEALFLVSTQMLLPRSPLSYYSIPGSAQALFVPWACHLASDFCLTPVHSVVSLSLPVIVPRMVAGLFSVMALCRRYSRFSSFKENRICQILILEWTRKFGGGFPAL